MIISHKHKFIFIKTEKTAGTSIEIALSKYCGDDDIITPLVIEDEQTRQKHAARGAQNYYVDFKNYTVKDWGKLLVKGHRKMFYHHMSAEEIKWLIPAEIWNNYYKFSFERNPWDKVISWYYWTYKSEPRPSLKEFIHSGEASEVKGWSLYTIEDQIIADRIGRFENLNGDILEISKTLGLPKPLRLLRSKSNFRKEKKSYRDLLDVEDRDAIEKMFSKEIDYFGYSY
ncbi:sulfotransferase family 2 domain-containing protein [Acaryochloris marina]|uniref:sulfotransferase family 2 domain-containing protein n=1 Tax=Acaryochloris marina TaxID=155978 RepID=UPI001BAECB44|nr:sulfotransferase family 2 domain-containing protein [Acaryochloris marina]QUY44826.1 sulfotransferase family 2 domain-containing protein [Acaryochloris marina S15]